MGIHEKVYELMTKFQIFIAVILVSIMLHSLALTMAINRIAHDVDTYVKDECGKCYYEGYMNGKAGQTDL